MVLRIPDGLGSLPEGSVARTQEERKAETRDRLVSAAADLFARKGFHATSTDAVADAADRTSGAVYSHFGGKEGLLLAVVEAWKEATAAETEGALLAASGHGARLEALWDTVADPPEERGGDAWMLLEHELWLFAARNPEVAAGLADRYAGARRAMGVAFEQWAHDAGVELDVPGEQLAVLVLALLFGLEMQRRVDPPAVPDELAVHGLGTLMGIEED